MAKASFIADDDFEWMLSTVGKSYPKVVDEALKAGAAVIAAQMKKNLESILSPWATGQLVASFGITPVRQNYSGDWNVHLGFDGYQEPGHVPFQLIARSFESGAVMGGRVSKTSDGKRVKKSKSEFEYWREPHPFAAPAVKAKRAEAERAMKEAAEGAITKITSGTGRRK